MIHAIRVIKLNYSQFCSFKCNIKKKQSTYYPLASSVFLRFEAVDS